MIKGTKNGYPDLLSRGMIIRCISENHRVITRHPKKLQVDHRTKHTLISIKHRNNIEAEYRHGTLRNFY